MEPRRSTNVSSQILRFAQKDNSYLCGRGDKASRGYIP